MLDGLVERQLDAGAGAGGLLHLLEDRPALRVPEDDEARPFSADRPVEVLLEPFQADSVGPHEAESVGGQRPSGVEPLALPGEVNLALQPDPFDPLPLGRRDLPLDPDERMVLEDAGLKGPRLHSQSRR